MPEPSPFIDSFHRDLYTVYYLTARVPEGDVQKACLEFLNAQGILAFHVDAGGKEIRGRAVGALKRAGRSDLTCLMGGKTGAAVAGVVDIIGVIPILLLRKRWGIRNGWGVPLFLEMKAPAWYDLSPKTGHLIQVRGAGALTPEQRGFLLNMRRAGAVVGVCWSVRDIKQIFATNGLQL